MRSLTTLCLFCLLTLSSLASGEDPVFSGPQIGETLAPLKVVGVYDRSAGKEIDPVAVAAGKPTLLVFVHKLTRPGMALTRAVTNYAASQASNGAVGAIVWLDDDKAKAEEYLTRARSSLNMQVPVGVSVDGGEGPGAYGLNRNVELTILVAKDNKVTANFALVQPSVTEAAKIAGELARLIDQPPPEQKQMEKLAFPNAEMMRDRMRRTANNPRPAAANPLRLLMQQLILAGSDETAMAVAVKQIDDWVGDDETRQASLGKMATAVLDRGLGSEAAQKTIKKWKEQYATKESTTEGKDE